MPHEGPGYIEGYCDVGERPAKNGRHGIRGPKGHINIRISHILVPWSNTRGYQKSCFVGSLCLCGLLGPW